MGKLRVRLQLAQQIQLYTQMLSRALILNKAVVLRTFFNYIDSFDFLNNLTYPSSLDNQTNNRMYIAGILDYPGQQLFDTHATTTARTPTPAYQGTNPIGVGPLTVLSSTDPRYFAGVRTKVRLQDRSLGNFSNNAGNSNSDNRSPP